MRRKLRIGLVDLVLEPDKPGRSGLSDIVWDMAKSFVKLGHEVHVIASYHSSQFPNNQVIVHNFQTPPMGYRNILGQLWILKRAARVIRSLPLDILHSPEYFSTACLALLDLDIPMVLTVPGNIFERIQNGNPFDKLTTRVLKTAARISARKCSKVIVTSEKMASWWSKTGVPNSKMVLIPYGIDTGLFKPIPGVRPELRISPRKKLLLFVGRLSPEKGVEFLIAAVSLLCKRWGNIELHLIGSGIQREHLQDLTCQLGIEQQVIFHGQIQKSRLPLYYSAADLTILPSLSEGLPRTMIEALACQSPFLGTRITGIEDHIQDLHTGYLVEPGNTKALANKVYSVLNDPLQARMIARNGADYVRINLTWLKIAQRIQDQVYYDVADSR
jgi:glycosyltransferase involved in cell wall biosynthesis